MVTCIPFSVCRREEREEEGVSCTGRAMTGDGKTHRSHIRGAGELLERSRRSVGEPSSRSGRNREKKIKEEDIIMTMGDRDGLYIGRPARFTSR